MGPEINWNIERKFKIPEMNINKSPTNPLIASDNRIFISDWCIKYSINEKAAAKNKYCPMVNNEMFNPNIFFE